MAIASGAVAGVSYKVESTRGTTPAGAFVSGRFTDRSAPQAEIGELTSNEVSQYRQETTIRSGFRQVTGTLGFELSRLAQDDLLELLTNDTWGYMTGSLFVHAGTCTGTTTNVVFTPTTAAVAVDAMTGMVAVVENSSTVADEGKAFQVIAKTSTTITLSSIGSALSGAAADITGWTFGQRLFTTSDAHRTASFQRRFPDITKYQLFKGVAVNEMSISARPESLVTGTFGLVGMTAEAMSGTEEGGAPTANPGATTTAFSPFTGCVFAAGTRLAIVTSFDLSVNNNRSTEAVLCQTGSPDVYEGVVSVTGTMTLLFEDETYYNGFLNETEFIVSARFADPAGGWMAFGLPRVRFTQPTIEIPSSGPVKITLPFRALQSVVTTTGGTVHTLVIQRSAAT